MQKEVACAIEAHFAEQDVPFRHLQCGLVIMNGAKSVIRNPRGLSR